MLKTKKLEKSDPVDVGLDLIPPEHHYLTSSYIIRVPLNDDHFADPWKLRIFATRLVERKLGDEVQVSDMKVKKPHLIAKSRARLHKQPPMARLYLTVRF